MIWVVSIAGAVVALVLLAGHGSARVEEALVVRLQATTSVNLAQAYFLIQLPALL